MDMNMEQHRPRSSSNGSYRWRTEEKVRKGRMEGETREGKVEGETRGGWMEGETRGGRMEGETRGGRMEGETRGGRMEEEGVAHEVARHYNEQRERRLDTRKRSKIITLKNYNNWVKSMNFNNVTNNFRRRNLPSYSLTGLDLCCGEGGDLRKWEKTKMMKHVVFVDIAEESVNRCKRRYEMMKEQSRRWGLPMFTAEFIVLDCAKESLRPKLSNPNLQFDLVSCQFALHYCFESFQQARLMLLNATENLRKGGYFFGTLPNADRIVRRYRQSRKPKISNKIYKIRFQCEEPYPIFGARYFFKLRDAVSCPEFLVHFPTLQALTTKLHMSLCYRTPFDDFHRQHSSYRYGKILLSKMRALESYPPSRGESLNFAKKYYKRARRFIRNGKRQAARERDQGGWSHHPYRYWKMVQVGTISSAEWQVIRLYVAFCFRKD